MSKISIFYESDYNNNFTILENIYDGPNKTPYIKVNNDINPDINPDINRCIPFISQNNGNWEINCKILSILLNYPINNYNIVNNKIEYLLEYGTPVYVKKSQYNEYLEYLNCIEPNSIFISDDILMWLILFSSSPIKREEEIKKHPNFNIWYFPNSNYSSILYKEKYKNKILEYKNKNIFGFDINTSKILELITAFEYKIIYFNDIYIFIEMYEPFGYNWFIENLNIINMGEIPYQKYYYKTIKDKNKFINIYREIDNNINNTKIEDNCIIYKIENSIKWRFIYNKLKLNKYIKNSDILYNKKLNIIDYIFIKNNDEIIIITPNNKYILSSSMMEKDLKEGLFLSNWDKSYMFYFYDSLNIPSSVI